MQAYFRSFFIWSGLFVVLLAGCGSGSVDPETLKKLPSPRLNKADPQAKPRPMITPVVQRKWELMAQAQDLLKAGNYDEIEKRLKEYRTSRAEDVDGGSKLGAFYTGLGYVHYNSSPAVTDIQEQLLHIWRKRHPESVAAQLALAYFYSRWLLTSKSKDDSENRRKAVDEKLEQAQAIIEATKAVKAEKLDWYLGASQVAYMRYVEQSEMNALLDEAVAQFPDVTYFYCERVNFLQNKRSGQQGEWQAYAARVARNRKGAEGDKLYAQLLWSVIVLRRSPGSLELKNFDWPRAKRGFEVMMKGPDPVSVAGAYAVAAWIVRDRATLRSIFQRQSARTNHWHSFEEYLEARKWAFPENGT